MSIYHAVSVTRHLLTSWNSAGIRTSNPFYYSLIHSVIRSGRQQELTEASERLRKEMLNDHRSVRVTDMGTGGWGRCERRVCDIAARAAVPPGQGALLARIAASEMRDPTSNKGVILELGTSLGISTLCLAAAAPQNRIITVEGCPMLTTLAKENFIRYGYENIEQINTDFSSALRKLKEEGTTIRFAYIDGNHTGEALREYFNTLMEMAGEEITIVADDIHLTRSMYKGWKSISRDSRIQLSVETLHFGLLFRKQSLISGSFKIRC